MNVRANAGASLCLANSLASWCVAKDRMSANSTPLPSIFRKFASSACFSFLVISFVVPLPCPFVVTCWLEGEGLGTVVEEEEAC